MTVVTASSGTREDRHATRVVPPKMLGCRRLTHAVLTEWPHRDANGLPMGLFLQFEPPRRRPVFRDYRYILGVDVADGIGQDRSVVDVIRMPTLEEPAEEVAQFVSNTVSPSRLAYIVDAIGRIYQDATGYEALAAIENNNHGISTQDLMKEHLGYTHFYVWEIVDQRDSAKRFTTRIGWVTNNRTRPMLLDRFYEAITTIDPITHGPDLVLNSPLTIAELRDFQTDGLLWEAEAARGAHDDCIIACAIGNLVAWRMAAGETEPIADRRRRLTETRVREDLAASDGQRYDFRNLPYSAAEQKAIENTLSEEPAPEPDDLVVDERALDLDDNLLDYLS